MPQPSALGGAGPGGILAGVAPAATATRLRTRHAKWRALVWV